MARSTLLQVLSVALQILSYQGQNTSTPVTLPMVSPEICQRVTDVPICEHMPWNYTLFPNFRGHSSQTEANQELEQFRQLIELKCSGAIVLFLCSIYAPFCTEDHPLSVVPPCKRLCQHVRDECEPVFNERAGGLPWPDQLNCDYYEDNLCFGPQDPNEVTIPPKLLRPGGEITGTSDTPGNTDSSMPKSTYTTSSILNVYPTIEPTVYPTVTVVQTPESRCTECSSTTTTFAIVEVALPLICALIIICLHI